jgi:polysaccharide biosynthesis/export protein
VCASGSGRDSLSLVCLDVIEYYTGMKQPKLMFKMFNPIKYIALTLLSAGLAVPAAAQEPPGGAYTVQPGDILEVSVWKEVDLQREVLVRPDGRFSFPLAGDIEATGKTVADLRAEISSRLQKYIPDLVVTVTVKNILGNKVYVLGQVNNPGEFVVNPRVDVMQALSMAGGTTAFAALNDIVILRRGEDGTQRAIKFAYKDVEKGRSLEQNVLLRSGDVVVVP